MGVGEDIETKPYDDEQRATARIKNHGVATGQSRWALRQRFVARALPATPKLRSDHVATLASRAGRAGITVESGRPLGSKNPFVQRTAGLHWLQPS